MSALFRAQDALRAAGLSAMADSLGVEARWFEKHPQVVTSYLMCIVSSVISMTEAQLAKGKHEHDPLLLAAFEALCALVAESRTTPSRCPSCSCEHGEADPLGGYCNDRWHADTETEEYSRDELVHAIEEANAALFEVELDDPEHQIECHLDALPATYRDVVRAAAKAQEALQVVVRKWAEQS